MSNNEFGSNSMIKYLIGASRVKYSVLDEIFHEVYLGNHMVTLWVDAHSILYRLYRQKDLAFLESIPKDVAIKDLVVSFINVLGHYRRYFATRLHKTNDIIVFFNTTPPAYQTAVHSEYCSSTYDKYRDNHKDYSGVNSFVKPAMEFIRSILQFFEGIYLIDNNGIDDFTAMYYLMSHERYANSDHIIFSKSCLPNQLLDHRTYQLVGKRDKSYIITSATVYQKGILKDRKTVADEKMNPVFLPFIWTLGGCSDIELKKSKYARGVSDAVKLLNSLVAKGKITSDMSIQSFLREYSNHIEGGMELRLSPSKMINRYRAVNIPLATAALTKDQKIRIEGSLIDLFNQNDLERINDMLSDINTDGELLEITNLNMSTVYQEEDLPYWYM